MSPHKKKHPPTTFEEPQSPRIQAAFCSIITTPHPFPLFLPLTPLFPPNLSSRISPSAAPPLGFFQVTQVLVGNVLPPLLIHLFCSWALTWAERGPPIRAPCSGQIFEAPMATETKIWERKLGFGGSNLPQSSWEWHQRHSATSQALLAVGGKFPISLFPK